MQVAVHGRRSQVTVTTSQAAGEATSTITILPPLPERSGFWTRGRKIGAGLVGLAAIVSALIAVIQYVH